MITKGDEMMHSDDISVRGERACKDVVKRPETF